jgi:hypothetical protein
MEKKLGFKKLENPSSENEVFKKYHGIYQIEAN